MSAKRAPWRLNHAIPIKAGESLDGYVARVAAGHHMPRMALITEVAGAVAAQRQHATFCDEAELDALADCLRIDPKVLRLHAPGWSLNAETLNFFGTRVPRDFLQFQYRRYSPSALTLSPHHRGLWQLRMLPICTETWEYLEDRCPNPACGRRQGWRLTPSIDLCDACAEPLSRAAAKPVPQELRENLEMLVGLIHPDPARRAAVRALLPKRLTRLEGGELLELACALAPVANHLASALLQMRTLSLSAAADVIVPALAQTWTFLQDWPRSLEEYVADRINRNADAKRDGNRGVSYRLFSKFDQRGLSQPVCAVIREFVEHCRNAGERGMTIAEAAQATGGRRRALVAMRKSGELPPVLTIDGGRLSVLVDRTAVADLIARNRPRELLFRAAWQLGVPTYTAHELLKNGDLVAAHPPPGCTEQLAVDKASLQAFESELLAQIGKTNNTYNVNLAKLMRHIGGRPKPWASVLSAIRTGELPVGLIDGKEPLARRLTVKDEDVLALPIFAEDQHIDWSGVMVTKADCADMMNIVPHNFSPYCEFLFGPGGYLRDITMEEAIRLAKTYIFTGELGHRLGVHHSAARHLADFRGLKSEFIALFKRAQAERLIPEIGRRVIGGSRASSAPAFARVSEGEVTMQSSVTPDGRLRLPPYLRRTMGLGQGGKVLFEETPDGVLMRNAHQTKARPNGQQASRA